METLLVKLDQNLKSASWLILDENGQPRAAMHNGSVEQLKDFSQQRRVACLLDSSDIYIDQVHLPASRNRRKLLQAIPFAMEDDLADDLENLHFSLGKEQIIDTADSNEPEAGTTKQIRLPVAIVSKKDIAQYLDTLIEAGVKPHGLFPDMLALPQAENQWHALVQAHKAIVRTGPQSGFTCDLPNLAVMLGAALTQCDKKPKQIQIWNHNQDDLELSLQDDDVELIFTNTDQPPLATLARGFRTEAQINLLQGEFSYKEEYGKLFKHWSVPAVLLSALILVALVVNLTAYFQLKSRNDTLDRQIVETYKKVFPKSKNLTNPRRQLETKLNSLGGGEESPLLQLLSAASMQISITPGASIQSLDFNGEFLDVELTSAEVAHIEEISQHLQNQGLSAEIKSADTKGDSVTGEVRIGLK